MSWQALAWAKTVTAGGPGPKSVLLCLADRADEAHSCYPSQATLAKETEQSERTVRRQLADLEERGLIRRERRTNGTHGRASDRFYLLLAETISVDGRPETQPDNLAGKDGSSQPAKSASQPAKSASQPAKSASQPDTAVSYESSVEPSVEPTGGTVSRKRGTRLPDDWTPSEDLRRQMAAECPGVPLFREHQIFGDYWRAQPGQKGVKLDWDATWRNWMRKAHKDLARRNRFDDRPTGPITRREPESEVPEQPLAVDSPPSIPRRPIKERMAEDFLAKGDLDSALRVVSLGNLHRIAHEMTDIAPALLEVLDSRVARATLRSGEVPGSVEAQELENGGQGL